MAELLRSENYPDGIPFYKLKNIRQKLDVAVSLRQKTLKRRARRHNSERASRLPHPIVFHFPLDRNLKLRRFFIQLPNPKRSVYMSIGVYVYRFIF